MALKGSKIPGKPERRDVLFDRYVVSSVFVCCCDVVFNFVSVDVRMSININVKTNFIRFFVLYMVGSTCECCEA